MEQTQIAIFKKKEIRKTLYQNEWWFSVVDIVEALTDSPDPHDYWYRMKIRVKSEENTELSTMCRRLKLPSSDGKKYETDCVDTEDAFRIVQSIPSPKAEPFKRWLAKIGYERIQEIENPELATKRTRMTWRFNLQVAHAATIVAELKPSFQADLTNSLILQAGTGSPTYSRATTAYVSDWEGLLV